MSRDAALTVVGAALGAAVVAVAAVWRIERAIDYAAGFDPCPTFRWDCHDDPYSAPSGPRPACVCGHCPEVSPGRQLRAGERP